VRLAGTRLANELVAELAVLLRKDGADSTAAVLEHAVMWGKPSVSLMRSDREALLRVLAVPPRGFEHLRSALDEHGWEWGGHGTALRCPECECVSTEAPGWVAVIDEDEETLAVVGIVAYCPPCAQRLLGYEPRSRAYT
jgi:hypothetical protein